MTTVNEIHNFILRPIYEVSFFLFLHVIDRIHIFSSVSVNDIHDFFTATEKTWSGKIQHNYLS